MRGVCAVQDFCLSMRDEHSETTKLRLLWRPLAFIALLLALWEIGIRREPSHLLPGPVGVVGGIADLVGHGLLTKYVVASLFRVTWGFTLAVVLAVPLGLAIGWYRRAEMALNPILQILRPISPLAWIPIAILVVRSRRSGGDLPDFRRMLFPAAAHGDQCRAEHSGGLHQCGPEFRPELPQAWCIGCCIRRWSRV